MLQNKLLFIICIKIIILFGVSAHIQEFNDVHIYTPAYMIAAGADLLNLTTCKEELQEFRDAVDHRILWSLKMLDSSGTFKPSFLYGNNYWLGSPSRCLDTMKPLPLLLSQQEILNNTFFCDSKNELPPFRINYFVARFKHNSTLQYHMNVMTEDIISLGLCLPESCINEISFILETIFHNKVINGMYSANFQLIQIKDLKNDNWLNNGVLYFICVSLGFFLLMTIIGTLYDVFIHEKYLKNFNRCQTNERTEVNSFPHKKSKIEEVLLNFSACINGKHIFNMDINTDDTFLAIHGLKVLFMCIIITAHNCIFSWDTFDNKISIEKLLFYYPSIIYFLPVMVNIFFFSIGFLATYLYLRRTKGRTNASTGIRGKFIEFLIYIIKRFVRCFHIAATIAITILISSVILNSYISYNYELTPAYMVVLGITQITSAWFDKTSQFHIYDKSHETCLKYWWRNLLYINNLFDLLTMCMSWIWYLANDMQFCIISMILLIFLNTCFHIAATIVIMILISSVILNGYISYNYELDKFTSLINIIYFPPWIQTYIIGIISGYILIKLDKNLILNKKITCVCLGYVILCNIYLFIFPFYEKNVFSYIIYITLYRLLWAINIVWIVIVCCKHGGIVNWLLSLKGWMPLSKLTYCAFLLNPIIIQSISLHRETARHFDFLSFIFSSILYIIITYICSFILSLLVEIPCISLLQIFIQNINKNTNYKKYL